MSDDLTRLREIAAAATPGPWWQEGSGPSLYVYGMKPGGRPNGEGIIEARYFGREGNPADAEFIATFDPPTVAALIDRAERAEEQVAAVLRLADEFEDDGIQRWGGNIAWHIRDVLTNEGEAKADTAVSELAALRAAVTGLADEWEERAMTCCSLTCQNCGARYIDPDELRALLTDEGNNDGRVSYTGYNEP